MKILVAVDFSDGSRKALAIADKIASKFRTKLILVHVIHDPATAPGFYAAKKAGEKVLHNMMNDFARKSLPKGRKVDKRVIPGLPAAQIVYLAKKEEVDLIVMGTHGLSGLKRLMIGSVVDKVMRASPIPVLAVPEKGGGKIGKEGAPDDVAEDDVDEIGAEEAAEETPADGDEG